MFLKQYTANYLKKKWGRGGRCAGPWIAKNPFNLVIMNVTNECPNISFIFIFFLFFLQRLCNKILEDVAALSLVDKQSFASQLCRWWIVYPPMTKLRRWFVLSTARLTSLIYIQEP